MTMPRLIVVSGDRNSGKTSWVCSLVDALVDRGLRVGTVKHTHHDFAVVGKDTTRHQDAGAERVVLVAPRGEAVYERWDEEPPLSEIVARHFEGFEVVLAEGYRESSHTKIVVGESHANPENVLARVSAATGSPPPDEVEEIAARIVELTAGDAEDEAGA
jgi:molybdopterin-guanine dinucleotide biosynthesis protein B